MALAPAALSEDDRPYLRDLAAGFAKQDRTLLDCLHAIQAKWGFLPRAALEEFGFEARLAREQVHSAVSFYTNFRLEPGPEVEVRVCTTLTCHLAGAPKALRTARAVADAYGKGAWEARAMPCLGLCELAPAMQVQGTACSAAQGVEPAIAEARGPPAQPRYHGLAPYQREGGHAMLQRALREPGWATREVKASGLRGMGGAGFSAGSKWEFVQKAPGSPKYAVLNADEGEPGTFKDRWLLEREPHRVLEGLLIAMAEVGASKGIVYLREEYAAARTVLEQCLAELRQAGLVGPDRELRLVVGAGSYVCGEETAMLESIEGRRGEPRLKPPYPAQHGLWGKPTLINNVETLWWVPRILREGAAAWKAQGRNGAAGLKLLSVSGHVAKPGVVEVPMGTTFREVFEVHAGGFPGGEAPKAFVPGGLASGLLPWSKADLPVDFDALAKEGSMLGSGGVVAIPPKTCLVDLAENGLGFFAHESCGKCTPCRVGTEKLLHFCRDLKGGKARREAFDLLAELSEAMAAASICGLGQTAMNPLLHGLRWFRPEFEAHLQGRCPEGVCR